MRILIVTHYFPPEIGAPQARLSELARYWGSRGDDVTVLTGMPNHPTGVVPSEYRRRVFVRERTDEYRILRTWLYATPNEKIFKRTLGHLSFMVSAVLFGVPKSGPADVVIVSSPTFFSILSAVILSRAKRAKLVVEVRDLWPALIVELGVLTNPLVIRILERLEWWFYRVADAIVVVTEGFRDHLVARGIAPTKVKTIRNGVDISLFAPVTDRCESARSFLGATEEDVLVLYIGAHGLSHGLTALADAAAALDSEAVHFSFVGEGAAKKDLERRVLELGASNVTLLPGVDRQRVPELVGAADICLVPLRDVPLFNTFIPSKIFEYFGAGKAVVGCVRGEAADILRAGGALVVEPEDSVAIAAAVKELAVDPSRRAAMGEQARGYVVEHFDRKILADHYRSVLLEVVEGCPT